MSGSLNRAMLIGHLGRDPDVRKNNAGEPIVNLSIATSESWRDKSTGERREKTEWHRVVIFSELAKIAEQYLKKGSKVYIEGQLQTREWTDKEGAKRQSTEIVLQRYRGQLTLLDGRDNNGGGQRKSADERTSDAPGGRRTSEILDDDIPFAPEWR